MVCSIAFLRRILHGPVTVHPALAPVNSVAPVVTGTAETGQTLNADNGTWSNSPTAYERVWQKAPGPGYSSWADISGATGSTYVLTSAEESYKVRFGIRAQNSAGWGPWAYSTATAAVAAPPDTTPYDYLVTSEADWDTVFALSNATLAGKIVSVRNNGTPYAARTVTWRPATTLTIIAENAATPPQLMRWTLDTSSNTYWQDIQFVDDNQSASSNCLTYISRSSNWLRDNTFKNCGWIGNYRGVIDDPTFDPTQQIYPEYACILPTFSAGVLTALTPSYVVGEDGHAFYLNYVGDLVADGTGYSFTFNNVTSSGGINWSAGVAPTATFDVVSGYITNITITSGGSGARYSSGVTANGYYRAGGVTNNITWTGRVAMGSILPGAFAVNSGTGGIPASAGTVLRGTWRYEDCYSRLCGDAFKHPAAEVFELIRCRVESVYQDAYSFGISDGVQSITMINCDTDGIFSADGHPADPHSDGMVQMFFTSSGAGKRVSDINITIQGNTLRNKHWENAQGIFLQTNVTPIVFYTGVISHNNILTRRQGNALTIGSQKNLICWRNIATHYHTDNVNNRDFDPTIAGEHGNTLKVTAGNCSGLGLMGKNIGEKFIAASGSGYNDTTTYPNLTVGVQYATISGSALFAAYSNPQTRAQQIAQVALKSPYTDSAYGPVGGSHDYAATTAQASDIPAYTRFTALTGQVQSSTVWTAWTPILAPEGTVTFSATNNVQYADDGVGTNASTAATTGSFPVTDMADRKFMRAQINTGGSAATQYSNVVTLNGVAYTATATTA